jgi:hypothetical protein
MKLYDSYEGRGGNIRMDYKKESLLHPALNMNLSAPAKIPQPYKGFMRESLETFKSTMKGGEKQ